MDRRSLTVAAISVALVTGCSSGSTAASAPTAAAPVSTTPVVATATAAPKLWRATSAPTNAPAGAEWIAIDTFDGKILTAGVVRPATGTPSAAVLVLPYWGGPRQAHFDEAKWLAGEGFIAIVVCWIPYTDADARATGGAIDIGCSRDAPDRKIASDVVKDVAAVIDAARTLVGSTSGKVIAIGDVEGATAAILAATLDAKLDGVVAVSGLYGCGHVKDLWGTCLPEQRSGPRRSLLIVHGTADLQGAGAGGRIAAAQAYEKQARGLGVMVDTLYVEGGINPLLFDSASWPATRAKIAQFVKSRL